MPTLLSRLTVNSVSPQLGCNHVGDEGVKAIAIALLSNAQRSKLVWLALGGNQITDRGAEHLAVALKLQHFIREDPLQGEGEGRSGGWGGRMGRRSGGGRMGWKQGLGRGGKVEAERNGTYQLGSE